MTSSERHCMFLTECYHIESETAGIKELHHIQTKWYSMKHYITPEDTEYSQLCWFSQAEVHVLQLSEERKKCQWASKK